MRYMACKGSRIKSRFLGVDVKGYMWVYNCSWSGIKPHGRWLEIGSDEYMEATKNDNMCFSSNAVCRTVRAFRRMLRKHKHIRGKARLVSRFIGHDVLA